MDRPNKSRTASFRIKLRVCSILFFLHDRFIFSITFYGSYLVYGGLPSSEPELVDSYFISSHQLFLTWNKSGGCFSNKSMILQLWVWNLGHLDRKSTAMLPEPVHRLWQTGSALLKAWIPDWSCHRSVSFFFHFCICFLSSVNTM